jgi:AcrR family transcriptional regulator
VVAAARRIGAQQGIEALSMRRLAEALGVMPNALYTYLPNKASILDAVLDDLLGDVERPSARTGWRNALVAMMSSYRGLLLSQPGLIPVTVSRPMVGPNAMQLREDMLTRLRQGALSADDAVNAYLALFAFTTGFVAFEAARVPGAHDARQRAKARGLYESLSDQEFPSTRALAGRLARRPGDREFTRGLHGVIGGFSGGE